MRSILFLNGPNLGRLGQRKPNIYGSETLAAVEQRLRRLIDSHPAHELIAFQSNTEGEIIDFIDRHRDAAGIILNPGALMMQGWSLRDALEDFDVPVVEVHISHIFGREAFRHTSVIAPVCDAMISGLGTKGYDAALCYLLDR